MRRLAHLQEGTGPRPLVLLHGFLGSARNVAGLARRLVERDSSLSVFALDLTGHGASPPLPPDADLATVAADVVATGKELGITPLRIVGHSLGGRVALKACLLPSVAVTEVTLLDIGPSPVVHDDDVRRILEALEAAPADAETREVFRRHLRGSGLPPETVEWLLLNLEEDAGHYRWRIDREALAALHRRAIAEDLWSAVEPPHARIRCIRGARSRFVDEAEARRLRSAGCPVETIDGAGHFLHVDRADELVSRLLRPSS